MTKPLASSVMLIMAPLQQNVSSVSLANFTSEWAMQ